MSFQGFSSKITKMIAVPEPFFLDLLPYLKSADEIKIILYTFWSLSEQERSTWYVRYQDYLKDEVLMRGLQPDAENSLNQALTNAVKHHALLKGEYQGKEYYFVNSPRGRAAVKALENGVWNPDALPRPPVQMGIEQPTIFHLYEENIGPLTPIMSEILQDAEDTYADDWIRDAIRIAVEKNIRNWRYVEAILKSWQKEGRHEKDRQNDQKDRRKYIEGEYGDLIEY